MPGIATSQSSRSNSSAHAAAGAGCAATGLAEHLEDLWQVVGGDALPVVDDIEPPLRAIDRELDLDHAADRRELGGVAEQVPDDLLDAHRVGVDRRRGR